MVTRLFPALIFGLVLIGACRRSFPVCSSHGDCPGGRCVLGKCEGWLDGGIDVIALDAPLWPLDVGRSEVGGGLDGGDGRPGDGRRDVPNDGREVGDGRAIDSERVDGTVPRDVADAPVAEDGPRDAPLDGNKLGPLGYVRSTTGTALPLWVQGSQVYLGDWGLAPAGTAARGNLQVYDVSDSTRPVLRDNFYPCTSECELSDITGDGSMLYVGTHGMGVFSFNMLGPARTPLSERLVNPTGSGGAVSAAALATLGGSTYLLVGEYATGLLRIYDVTSDSALAAPLLTYSMVDGKAESLHAIEVSGTMAYLFAGVPAGEVIEFVELSPIATGAQPTVLGRWPWARKNGDNGAGGGYGRMRVKDGLLYVAAASLTEDELAGGATGGLRILDVSNPANPQFINGCNISDIGNIPGRGPGLDIDESGKWAYVVTSKGLQLVDISVPMVKVVLGPRYDLPAEFLPCFGGRAVYSRGVVYVSALCRSDDGSMGRGGLAIYLAP